MRTKGYFLVWALFSVIFSLIVVITVFDGNFNYFVPVFLFFIFVIFITCYIQLLGIWHNLNLTEKLLSKMANSNVDFSVELKQFSIINLKDSISFLSAAFQKLINQVEVAKDNIFVLSTKLSKNIEDIYKSNLSKKSSTDFVVQSSFKIDELLVQIEGRIRETERIISNAGNTSEEIKNNSENIYHLVDELVGFINTANDIMLHTQKSLTENKHAISEIEGFINYMSQSIEDLNSFAEGIEQNVSSTVQFQKMVLDEVQKSEEVIHNYSHSIDTIRNTILSTNKTVELLSEDSDQINRIIEAIEIISRQTSLLSLNASIIASISKESGKSFNVVAEEIMLLSERTELSTREIAIIIDNIKTSIEKSKDNIRKSISIVDYAEGHSQELYESLLGIVDLAKNSILNVQNIQQATSGQLKNYQIILHTTEDIKKQCMEIKQKNSVLQSEYDNLQIVAKKLNDIANGLKSNVHSQLYDAKEIIDRVKDINDAIMNIFDISAEISAQRETIENTFDEFEGHTLSNMSLYKELMHLSFNMSSEYNKLATLTDYYKGLRPQKGGELIISYHFLDNPIIDPALLPSAEKVMITSCIYEPLLTYTSSSDIQPLLCEDYKRSKDGSKITFYLKKDIYFHNGQHLTSRDVKYTFERLKYIYEENSPKLLQFLGPIYGYEDFIKGVKDKLEGVKIIDDYTIEINLAKPLVYYIVALCQLEMSIVPYRSFYTRMPRPNGTGPFKFKKYVENDYLVLEKNSKYHIPEVPYIDFLRFQSKLTYHDLMDNNFHLLHGVVVPDTDISKFISSDKGVLVEPIETYSPTSVLMNLKIQPFDCKYLRKAFLYSINREKMITSIYHNHNRKAESFIPPGVLGHNPRKDLIRYDIEQARELASKSRYNLPMETEYYVRDGFKPSALIQFLFDSLQSIGISVKCVFLDPAELSHKRRNQPFNIITWHADFLDPDNFIYGIFHSKNIETLGSDCGYKSKTLDSLIEAAQYEHDTEKRKQMYYDVEEIIISESIAFPLCYSKVFLAHRYELICPVKSVSPFFEPKYCWFFIKK